MSQLYALPEKVANPHTFSSMENPEMSFLAFASAVLHASLKSGITCGSLETGGGFDGSVRMKIPVRNEIFLATLEMRHDDEEYGTWSAYTNPLPPP